MPNLQLAAELNHAIGRELKNSITLSEPFIDEPAIVYRLAAS